MSELETKLRALAARGEFTYFSVVPVAGKGGVVFHAQVSPASRFGHSEGRDADPVTAILTALDGLPKTFTKEPSKRAMKEFGDPAAEPRARKEFGDPAAEPRARKEFGDPVAEPRARKEFGDPAAEPREPREPWDVIQ